MTKVSNEEQSNNANVLLCEGFNLYAFSKIDDVSGSGFAVKKGQLIRIKLIDAWDDCNCEWIRIAKKDLELWFYVGLN